MEIDTLPDTSGIDSMWLDGGLVKAYPAAFFESIPLLDRRVWCMRNARYGLPTTELVEWLMKLIGGRTVIEVGAGQGDLGAALGIPMSDNYCQQRPELIEYYARLGQAPTNPPLGVEMIEASDAISKHKPQVVVASWLTHRFNGETGNMYGPDENDFLDGEVETYVHVGNENVHGSKSILRFKHEEIRSPWILSRAADQSKNVIWVWNRPKCGWKGIG
jgi:hypothetical protein